LTPEHIQIGVDKELWLITSREKTDNAEGKIKGRGGTV